MHFSQVVYGGLSARYSVSSRVVLGAPRASRDFEWPSSVRGWYGTVAAGGRAKRILWASLRLSQY